MFIESGEMKYKKLNILTIDGQTDRQTHRQAEWLTGRLKYPQKSIKTDLETNS